MGSFILRFYKPIEFGPLDPTGPCALCFFLLTVPRVNLENATVIHRCIVRVNRINFTVYQTTLKNYLFNRLREPIAMRDSQTVNLTFHFFALSQYVYLSGSAVMLVLSPIECVLCSESSTR